MGRIPRPSSLAFTSDLMYDWLSAVCHRALSSGKVHAAEHDCITIHSLEMTR